MDERAEMLIQPGSRDGTYFFHAKDGYTYHFNKLMKGGRLSMRCIYYNTRKVCKARCTVSSDGTAFRRGTLYRHNHLRDRNLIHERRFRRAVLNECRKQESAQLSLKTIYHQVRRTMQTPAMALVNIPFVKLRPSMDRARRSTLPDIPHTLSELAAIMENDAYSFLNTTLDGEDCIYLGKCGQTNQETRCLIFASRRMLAYMRNVKKAFSDATFSSVPAALGCSQIWTILTVRRHHIIPMVRIMMQSKRQDCYLAALQAIRRAVPEFSPTSVMCDFETAQANAWEAVFPLATIGGCLFHSSKAICSKAKEMGLIPIIRRDENVDSIVRSCCALALLPPNMDFMREGLASIAHRAYDTRCWHILSPLLRYVRDTWFSPSKIRMLSVHGFHDRTSNAFALIDLEDITQFDITVLDSGFTPSRKRKASALANDKAIAGFQEELADGDITVELFLRRASRRLQGVVDMIL